MLSKISEYIRTHSNKQILGFIIILVILAVLPLTIIVSQQQQEIRQRATESLGDCINRCYNEEGESMNFCETYCRELTSLPTPIPLPTTEDNNLTLVPTPTETPTPTSMPTLIPVPQSSSEKCYNDCYANGNSDDYCDNKCGSQAQSLTSPPIPTSEPTTAFIPTSTPVPTIVPTIATSTCPLKSQGDADCDGKVDILDFNIWISEFTKELSSQKSDFDGDGLVTIEDFYSLEFTTRFRKK